MAGEVEYVYVEEGLGPGVVGYRDGPAPAGLTVESVSAIHATGAVAPVGRSDAA